MIELDTVGHSPTVTPATLMHHVQTLLDVTAIKDLVAIYPVLVDSHDLDALVDTFADDGEISRAGTTHKGHVDLRTFYTHIMKLYSMMVHTQHHHIVQVAEDGRTATGLTFGHSETRTLEGVQLNGAFRYDDEYVKVNGLWKFRSRLLRYQYMSAHSDMGARLEGKDRIRLPDAPARRAEIPEDIPAWQTFRQQHS